MKISVIIAALAGTALFVGVAYAQMPAAKPLPTVPKLAPAGSHKLQVHMSMRSRGGDMVASDYALCMPAAAGPFFFCARQEPGPFPGPRVRPAPSLTPSSCTTPVRPRSIASG